MKVKKIVIILREDGFFHHENQKIKAYYPGKGYVVTVFLESSPIDEDFQKYVWVG